MDAVRFGRALGFGTRQAAKTVIGAVHAARAENPSKPVTTATPQPTTSTARGSVLNPPRAVQPVTRAPIQRAAGPIAQARGVQEGISRFKTSAVEPVVRLSSVLWLEVTGAFFAIFALAAANGVWRLRNELRTTLSHPFAHASVLGTVAIFALFAYFSVSSFVRAHRRQRRRG
jgi:hypothetical protein